MGKRADCDEEDTLLLKVVQSVPVKQPVTPEEALVQPSVPPVPIWMKEPVSGAEGVRVDVATLNTVLLLETSASCPCTQGVVVASPIKLITGVAPPVDWIGYVPVTLVTVPCGWAVHPTTPEELVVRALVPLQFEAPTPVMARVVVVALVEDARVANKP